MNTLPMEKRVVVAAALADGVSMRGTERLTGVTRQTIGALLLRLGDGAVRLHDALMHDLTCDVLEFDEVWAFVGVKEGHRDDAHPEEFGDAYTFVGLDATSRAVVSHLTDKRSAQAATAFAADVRARVLGVPQITTDGLKSYLEAIEFAFGTRVHYAQNLKTYAVDEAGGASRDDVRYSRGRCVASQKRTIVGAPDESRVTTAHIERNNLTTRMWCRRLTRLTTCFSRRLAFLRAAMAWHFAVYNFTRVHASLRVTPAVQLGVTDHVWSMEELIGEVLERVSDGGASSAPTTPVSAPAPTPAMAPFVRVLAERRTARRRRPAPVASAPTEPVETGDTFPPPPDAASDFRWLW